MFLRKPLPIHKVVSLDLDNLAHGYVVTFMADWFYVGVFTIYKHMDIIIDFLFDEQKSSAQYISILQGDRLQHTIAIFNSYVICQMLLTQLMALTFFWLNNQIVVT